jgi:hypothetical protein
MVPHQALVFHCKLLSSSLSDEGVVAVINRQLICPVDLEGCLITAFPTGQATTSLEGLSVQERLSLWLKHDGAPSNFG